MKKAILLFAAILTMGTMAFAQSADGQNSTYQLSQEDKQLLNDKLDNFYTMISATTSQQQQLDEIAEEYYGYYLQNKDQYSTKEDLQSYQQVLVTEAMQEAKPILTNEQWTSVKEVVEERKSKLEKE